MTAMAISTMASVAEQPRSCRRRRRVRRRAWRRPASPGQLPGGRESEQESGGRGDEGGERHHAQIERERAGRPGRPSCGMKRGAMRISTHARPSPPAPPSTASSRLSVSNCLTSRAPPAPSDVRTAISRARAAPRASIRLATLAHAIRRMNSTSPASTKAGGPQFRADQRLAQRIDRDAPALVGGGRDLRDARGDPGHRGPRLLDGYTGLQAAEHLQIMHAPLLRTA